MSRVAVVTGGASGLGLAICNHLTRHDRRVAVLDLDGDAAEHAAAALRDTGAHAIADHVDVSDRAAVDRAFDAVRAALGPIEILVTSAAVAGFVPFEAITLDDWQRTIAVNLTGTFHCLQAAIPDMTAARWGRIVTISSAAGQTGSPRQAHYSASKGGVIALTKTVALEYAAKGITANTVSPFTVDTPMLRAAQTSKHLPDADVLARMIPAGRLGTPDDIAAACAFLCSDDASYITGQVIAVNGGALDMSDRFSLDGRVAIITGGGTGIGRGTALVLAEHGADVVLAARRPEPLASTAKDIEALGRRALAVPTDVTKAEQCQQLVETTLEHMGRVDILVNNAGGAETKSIMKWTEDEWRHVVALNLGSVWFLSRAAAAPMLEQGKGAIVNISSGASLLGMPQAAPYGAAKAAVNNLTASMAAAWTRKGVRVNTIAVGAVRAASLLDDAARYGLDPDAIGLTNASGRLGEPEEIGYGVLFFASDASSFCSGQTLSMHGGPGPAGV